MMCNVAKTLKTIKTEQKVFKLIFFYIGNYGSIFEHMQYNGK